MHPNFLDLINEEGHLFSPTAVVEWSRPAKVELCTRQNRPDDSQDDFELLITGTRARWRYQRVRVPDDLLERFLALQAATPEEIARFASKFGGLDRFSRQLPTERGLANYAQVEFLEVWRYFARSMAATLNFASCLYRSQPITERDWCEITSVPSIMREICQDYLNLGAMACAVFYNAELQWLAHVDSFEEFDPAKAYWLLSLSIYSFFVLGRVTPTLDWPHREAGYPPKSRGPSVVYASIDLCSHLVMQLALRVARLDSFVLCAHCHQLCASPSQDGRKIRKPKARQRNFCHICRAAGIPAKYALRDFRNRKAIEKN
jgi:hypothetical protein